MLVSKIKKIEDGRVIVKDYKPATAEEAIRIGRFKYYNRKGIYEKELKDAEAKGDKQAVANAKKKLRDLEEEFSLDSKTKDEDDVFVVPDGKGTYSVYANKQLVAKGLSESEASSRADSLKAESKTKDVSLSEFDKKQLDRGKYLKIILPPGKGEPLYTDDFNAAKEMAKEYGAGTQVVNLKEQVR